MSAGFFWGFVCGGLSVAVGLVLLVWNDYRRDLKRLREDAERG